MEASALNEVHHQIRTAVCDTVVPALDRANDPDGFFARKASDLAVPSVLAAMIEAMPGEQRDGLVDLLEALGEQGFVEAARRSREQLIRNLFFMGAEVAAGVEALAALTLFLYYGLPDEQGQNPNWKSFGYPGPVSQPPQTEKPLKPLSFSEDTALEADVCIIGSGAGGGVMAGVLAEAGLK